MAIEPQKIAITGAGGWLGQELIEALLAEWGSAAVESQLVCFGSRSRSLELSDGTRLNVYELNSRSLDLVQGGIQGFVHLAFQTRDKVSELPLSEYIAANVKLTSLALQIIELSRPKWVATVSSGAALSSPEFEEPDLNVEANPYGFLKLVEENLLQELCTKMQSNLAIGRLWGAGGLFMPRNSSYALSQFVSFAIDKKPLEVLATNPVRRRYVDAGTFMRLLVSLAENERFTRFDSGGQLVEMGELARLVASKSGSNVVRRNYDENAQANDYFSKSHLYEECVQKFGLSQDSLEDVVERTMLSHLRATDLNRNTGASG